MLTRFFLETSQPLRDSSEEEEEEERSGDGDGRIVLVQQFFVSRDAARRKEIQFALLKNATNALVDKVFLLNERVYASWELGAAAAAAPSPKIEQVLLATPARLTYADALRFARERADVLDRDFVALANADIYTDASLALLRRSRFARREPRAVLALARHELQHARRFAATQGVFPRFDSQDLWIFRARDLRALPEHLLALFDFPLGVPGCDNKLLYLLHLLRFRVFNTPLEIRAVHCHASLERDYLKRPSSVPTIPPPYGFCAPHGIARPALAPSFGIALFPPPPAAAAAAAAADSAFEADNRVLRSYLLAQRARGRAVLVPALHHDALWRLQHLLAQPQPLAQHVRVEIQEIVYHLHTEHGLVLDSVEDVDAQLDLEKIAFAHSELFAVRETFLHDRQWVSDLALRFADLDRPAAALSGFEMVSENNNTPPAPRRALLQCSVMEAYHYNVLIPSEPWTYALRGLRLLVVLGGTGIEVAQLQQQWTRRAELFRGSDLFPDCVLAAALCPSRAQMLHDDGFREQLDAVRDLYDVALVSAEIWGNAVCGYIFDSHGRSAIHVGPALALMLGVVASAAQQRPDLLRLYRSDAWIEMDAGAGAGAA